jgi:hypothetical protein
MVPSSSRIGPASDTRSTSGRSWPHGYSPLYGGLFPRLDEAIAEGLDERREWEFANAETDRRRQEEAVRKSRSVHPGIPRPASADAALTAFEVMRGADADAERSDPHRRLSQHEEFLTRSFGQPVDVVEVVEEG